MVEPPPPLPLLLPAGIPNRAAAAAAAALARDSLSTLSRSATTASAAAASDAAIATPRRLAQFEGADQIAKALREQLVNFLDHTTEF